MRDEDWDDVSGPICRHWSDAECAEVCARCGHGCWDHVPMCTECDCPDWVQDRATLPE